ncbi:MAG: hypothetical protein A2W25_14695 [candidate division Zixibacteria bacterium RBG_16_53_22]|nr:MAG: hypothetical protein A2W25_14695 [candidate division Zixibacteria bacterium RBG_16_53_22]
MYAPSNAAIKEISELATIQISRAGRVETLEQELKTANEALRRVQEVDLPNAMAEAGVSSITLPTGEKITIKEDVYASIPKDERYEQALAWLRGHGFGDVIKNEVKVAFGKGEEESSAELLAVLNDRGLIGATTCTTGVHASTLKALIREQLAKGAEFPMDLFGAFPTTKAVIK